MWEVEISLLDCKNARFGYRENIHRKVSTRMHIHNVWIFQPDFLTELIKYFIGVIIIIYYGEMQHNHKKRNKSNKIYKIT